MSPSRIASTARLFAIAAATGESTASAISSARFLSSWPCGIVDVALRHADRRQGVCAELLEIERFRHRERGFGDAVVPPRRLRGDRSRAGAEAPGRAPPTARRCRLPAPRPARGARAYPVRLPDTSGEREECLRLGSEIGLADREERVARLLRAPPRGARRRRGGAPAPAGRAVPAGPASSGGQRASASSYCAAATA